MPPESTGHHQKTAAARQETSTQTSVPSERTIDRLHPLILAHHLGMGLLIFVCISFVIGGTIYWSSEDEQLPVSLIQSESLANTAQHLTMYTNKLEMVPLSGQESPSGFLVSASAAVSDSWRSVERARILTYIETARSIRAVRMLATPSEYEDAYQAVTKAGQSSLEAAASLEHSRNMVIDAAKAVDRARARVRKAQWVMWIQLFNDPRGWLFPWWFVGDAPLLKRQYDELGAYALLLSEISKTSRADALAINKECTSFLDLSSDLKQLAIHLWNVADPQTSPESKGYHGTPNVVGYYGTIHHAEFLERMFLNAQAANIMNAQAAKELEDRYFGGEYG